MAFWIAELSTRIHIQTAREREREYMVLTRSLTALKTVTTVIAVNAPCVSFRTCQRTFQNYLEGHTDGHCRKFKEDICGHAAANERSQTKINCDDNRTTSTNSNNKKQ